MATTPQGFSPVPGSQTTSPTDTDLPPPPKPVRKVYGRAKPRQVSPVPSAIIPSTSSSGLVEQTDISVAKFEAQQQKWLKTINSIGSRPLDEDEATDEEIDDEEAIRFMNAMRSGKDAAVVPGFASTSSDLTALATSSARQPAVNLSLPSASKIRRLPTFDSDSSVLTTLPPTTDPLSPPINIELAGQSKAIPPPPLLKATQSSPTPSHRIDLPMDEETLFPPKKLSTAKARIIESSDEDDDLPIKSTYKGKGRFVHEDDDDESTPGPSRIDKTRLSDDEDTDAIERAHRHQPSDLTSRRRKSMASTAPAKSGAADLVQSLFGDDDEEPLPSTIGRREKALKPLPQKALNEMRKDMSRAKREREPSGVTRITKDFFPISSFIANASAKVNMVSSSMHNNITIEAKHEQSRDVGTPGLSHADIDNTSSPSIPTPLDDITSFSSVVMDKDANDRYDRVHSSPSVKQGKKLQFVDRAEVSAQGIERKMPLAKRPTNGENKDDLQARKNRAAVAALRQAQAKQDDSDSDDLEVVKETPKKPTKPRPPPREAPVPKSRELSNLHLLAGIKTHAPRGDMSESYWQHAGKAFAHADTKVKQGARAQQGVSARKNEAVGLADVNRYMLEKARLLGAKLQKEKEDAWGTRRVLADKEELDLSAAVQINGDAHNEMDEEDVGEDEDYVPEGSGSEADDASEVEADDAEVDQPPVYSGEDDNEMEEAEADVTEDEDKENQPPNVESDEEQTPVARPIRARKVIRSPSGSPSAPLAPLPMLDNPSPELGLISPGGFGSDEGGFSQLFGETQVDNPAGDGFAALRQQNAAPLLPAHMLLPANHISASQVERDNAMVAAEADVEAQIAAVTEEESQPRYLNKQGFFTQTRPIETEETQSQALIYPTFTESLEQSSLSGPAYTATYVSPEKRSFATQAESPVQLHRLKRRRTGSPSVGEDTTPLSPSPTASPVKRNAFDLMHAAAARQKRHAERNAERAGFLEEEAEQSDEEDAWGTVRKDKDDEEEDDDEDAFVPDLVNDAARTAAQEEADKVARDAKRRELEAEDEQARLAAAKNVADGNWKIKKRGFEFDTSDNEDESQAKVGRKDQRRRRKIVAAVTEVETQPFEKSYQEGMDSDSDVEDDTLDRTEVFTRDDDTPSPSRQTAEQRNRQLRAVLAKQRELSAEPIDLTNDDEVEHQEFVITKSKTKSASKPVLPSSKSADRMREFLKDNAEKGNSTRKANGVSSSVVTAPKTSAPLRGNARAKSNSVTSMRSQSSISRLDRKGSGFL